MEVTIDAVVGGASKIEGTVEPVTGLVDGSTVISCDGFIEKRIYMTKNGLHLPLLEYAPGVLHHTKFILDNFISLNAPINTDDVIYIETISI